jgi:hypothetical protein
MGEKARLDLAKNETIFGVENNFEIQQNYA